MAPEPDRRDVPIARPGAGSGPILRGPAPHRRWREQHGRLLRFAEEWDRAGRPARLALDDDELRRFRRWLGQAPPELTREITAGQREFIAASEKVATGRTIRRILLAVVGFLVMGGLVTVAILVVPRLLHHGDAPEGAGDTEDATGGGAPEEPEEALRPVHVDPTPVEPDPDSVAGDVNAPIKHEVVPFETLDDIARRYGVSVDELADWNLLNPDDPELEGKTILVKRPTKRPLPQQKIDYEVERGETWTKLSKRFGVPVTRLRAYNPKVDRLPPGQTITLWVNPKPYEPRLPRKPIPEFHVDKRAVSVGSPNDGKLVNGIQMPESNAYTRRKPYIMWGSSNLIANLQKAVATFRQDVDFDGVVILADISMQHGGFFPPHKSHQAGRDIDIWLPTLKGVYKTKYLGEGRSRPRKPLFPEIDWYATWGLVRALIKTDAVKYIFLDWSRQEYVYRAAVNMGATEEELDEWIQWPRPKSSPKGIFRHSEAHLSHIHVRFDCAEWEPDCKARAVVEE